MSGPVSGLRPTGLRNVTKPQPASGYARYTFEQTVSDSWNGRDANDQTSAGYVTTAQVGSYAKDFDGSDDYVQLPFGDDFFNRSNWSISLWWNRRSTDTGNVDENLLGYNSRQVGIGYNDVNNDNGIEFQINAGSLVQLGDATIGNKEWRMLTLTWDAGTGVMYLDDGSTSYSGSGSYSTGDTNTEIGAGNDISQFMPVWVDDLRFYTKTLSQTEVSSLYNNGFI